MWILTKFNRIVRDGEEDDKEEIIESKVTVNVDYAKSAGLGADDILTNPYGGVRVHMSGLSGNIEDMDFLKVSLLGEEDEVLAENKSKDTKAHADKGTSTTTTFNFGREEDLTPSSWNRGEFSKDAKPSKVKVEYSISGQKYEKVEEIVDNIKETLNPELAYTEKDIKAAKTFIKIIADKEIDKNTDFNEIFKDNVLENYQAIFVREFKEAGEKCAIIKFQKDDDKVAFKLVSGRNIKA